MNQNIESKYYSAQQAHQNSDLNTAKGLYKEILTTNPGHSGALHFLGILYGQEQRYEEAIFYLNKAFEISPDNAELCNNLAEVYRRNCNLELALKYFKKANNNL
jgi:tetratricopeptide (TPR) repeat protein